MSFPAYQEQTLRERAEETGAFRYLAYYYAAKRELEKLHALDARFDRGVAADALTYDLLALEDGDALACDAMVARLDEAAPIWAYYTLTKRLLAEGRLDKALDVGGRSLLRDRLNTACLNLIARYAIHRGEAGVAGPLIDSILKVNGRQQDIEDLRQYCGETPSDAPEPPAPYLDVLPRHEEVSFYLPVYNVEAHIRGAIEGLAAQSYPIDEVIVVDDGTPDGAIEIAREYPVRIVEHGENRGLAAARNTAFQHTGATWVGAIDTDAVPEPDYAQYIMMELENRDPRVAGAGGPLRERHTETPPDRWRAVALSQDRGPQRICHSGLFGSNTVLQREAVLDVGGYDEGCRTNGEDWHICKRLDEAGRLLVYTPYAVAHHMRRDTLETVMRTSWAWFYWGRRRDGLYDRLEYVVAFWVGLLQCETEPMAEQCARNATGLLYVSLAHPFFTAYLDMGYCVERGLMTSAEAAHLQEAALEPVRGLDERLGGGLHGRLRGDLAPLRQPEAEAGGPVGAACAAQGKAFVQAADDVFRGWSREIYEAVLNAGS